MRSQVLYLAAQVLMTQVYKSCLRHPPNDACAEKKEIAALLDQFKEKYQAAQWAWDLYCS